MININPIWRDDDDEYRNNWIYKKRLKTNKQTKHLWAAESRFVMFLLSFFSPCGVLAEPKTQNTSGSTIDDRHNTPQPNAPVWMLVITSLDWTGGSVHLPAPPLENTTHKLYEREAMLRQNQGGIAGATRKREALFVNAAAAAAVSTISKKSLEWLKWKVLV